ncbi:hypothetical protein FB107DRAFT_251247 [Schizophyllum commune]
MHPPYIAPSISDSAFASTRQLDTAVENQDGRSRIPRMATAMSPGLDENDGDAYPIVKVGHHAGALEGLVFGPGESTPAYPRQHVEERYWNMQAVDPSFEESPIDRFYQPGITMELFYPPSLPGTRAYAASGTDFIRWNDYTPEMASSGQGWTPYKPIPSLPRAPTHSQSEDIVPQHPAPAPPDPRASILITPLLEDVDLDGSPVDGLKHMRYDRSRLEPAQRHKVASDPRTKATVARRGKSATVVHDCPYLGCDASFTRVTNLIDHILVHQDKKLYACFKAGCAKRFNTRSLRRSHLKCVHKQTWETEPTVVNMPLTRLRMFEWLTRNRRVNGYFRTRIQLKILLFGFIENKLLDPTCRRICVAHDTAPALGLSPRDLLQAPTTKGKMRLADQGASHTSELSHRLFGPLNPETNPSSLPFATSVRRNRLRRATVADFAMTAISPVNLAEHNALRRDAHKMLVHPLDERFPRKQRLGAAGHLCQR